MESRPGFAHEYDAAIQFACPGPTSRPSSLLNERPALMVMKLEVNCPLQLALRY